MPGQDQSSKTGGSSSPVVDKVLRSSPNPPSQVNPSKPDRHNSHPVSVPVKK